MIFPYVIFWKYKNNGIGELNLRISNDNIEHVNEFTFVGLHLSSKLIWDTHVNIIEKRISRAVGNLFSPKQFSCLSTML